MGGAGNLWATRSARANQTLCLAGRGGGHTLLQLNLLFGLVYLPWQIIHLSVLRANARRADDAAETKAPISLQLLASNLGRSLHERNAATDAASWGGVVGLSWMTAYWATVIPIWVYQIVRITAVR
jgi:hypothetical protein